MVLSDVYLTISINAMFGKIFWIREQFNIVTNVRDNISSYRLYIFCGPRVSWRLPVTITNLFKGWHLELYWNWSLPSISWCCIFYLFIINKSNTRPMICETTWHCFRKQLPLKWSTFRIACNWLYCTHLLMVRKNSTCN